MCNFYSDKIRISNTASEVFVRGSPAREASGVATGLRGCFRGSFFSVF